MPTPDSPCDPVDPPPPLLRTRPRAAAPDPESTPGAEPGPRAAPAPPPGHTGLAAVVRNPRTWLFVYAGTLAAIAFWPVPVDSGAGALLRLITRVAPVLTYARIEFGANVLLFVPLGLLLSLILPGRRWRVLPIALAVTVTIECVQALLLGARTASVLDIVANTAGAAIGMTAAAFIHARRRRTR